MGRKLVSDKAKRGLKNSMSKMVDDIGRNVSVYTTSRKKECTNCYYDNVNDKSSGKCKWTPVEASQKQADWEAEGNISLRYRYFVKGRCPVCEGLGYLVTLRRKTVKCIVNWGGAGMRDTNYMIQTPAGKEGATEVLLKSDPKYYDLFKNCSKIKVDNISCELSNPPLIRGPGNDVILVIIAYTSEVMKKGKSNIVKGYYE